MNDMPTLTEENASLTIQGEHRLWVLKPHPQHGFEITSSPVVGTGNPVREIDGKFYPSLQAGFTALLRAESEDTGESLRTPIPDLSAVPEGTLIFQRTASTERHDMGRVIPAITEYRRLWAFAPHLDSHKETRS